MPEFDAGRAFAEAKERNEQVGEGDILVPVLAAIIAVLAALGTLFANHNSIAGLAEKNEAILHQIKSADQYAYYESSRIKTHVYQALLGSGVVASPGAKSSMQATANREQGKTAKLLHNAQEEDVSATTHFENSEGYMRAYEKFEVATTLFEVSIVMVSVTALMRTRMLLYVAGAATIAGLGFFTAGFLH